MLSFSVGYAPLRWRSAGQRTERPAAQAPALRAAAAVGLAALLLLCAAAAWPGLLSFPGSPPLPAPTVPPPPAPAARPAEGRCPPPGPGPLAAAVYGLQASSLERREVSRGGWMCGGSVGAAPPHPQNLSGAPRFPSRRVPQPLLYPNQPRSVTRSRPLLPSTTVLHLAHSSAIRGP